MPIIPESRRSRQDVKASIAAQFWEQPVHSTRSLDGQLWALPCEPPPLNLTGSSGLSRTQQLIAAQAVRVPFFPSYDGGAEGLVLDRVLARAGGQRWWAALSGRVKAQRAYNRAKAGEGRKLEAVRDLGNYALCARGRFRLGRRLTLNGVVEAPDADQLQRRLAHRISERRAAAAVAGSSADGAEEAAGAAPAANGAGGLGRRSGRAGGPPPELEPYTAHAVLRCALPGHDLSATAGYNLQYVDSSGDVAHVPLAASLDLASHDRQDGLQYRVGLHQVTAPPTELPARPGGQQQRWRTSLHAQGALAVEGEAYIWKGGAGKEGKEGAAKEAGGKEAGGNGASQPAGEPQAAGSPGAATKQPPKGSGGEDGGGGSEEPRRTRLASALEKAAAADKDAAEQHRRGNGAAVVAGGGASAVQGPTGSQPGEACEEATAAAAQAAAQADAGTAPTAAAPAAAAAAATEPEAGRQPGASLEQFMRPLEQLGERVSDMLHNVTHPGEAQQQPSGGGAAAAAAAAGNSEPSAAAASQQQQGTVDGKPGGSISGGSSSSGGSPSSGPLLGLSSQSITATIQDSVALLQQVRESVERLTTNVQDGSLQRLSQQLVDTRNTPQRRRPYSMLLAQPHLKLNAALGCLARMPLPALRAFSFPTASLEPLEQYQHHQHASGPASARATSTSSLASRASHASQLAEAWQPYFKGTALRVFASAGVSGQLGRFSRPFLDYTAASARLDVGLTSPHVVGVVPDASALAAAAADGGHRPDKHRAFALEGRGAWHALSVSLAQQVFGPVRARVDARFALDPTSVPASEGERSTLKGVLQTALSVRPSLLEASYGFDCVLPGTEGAARLAANNGKGERRPGKGGKPGAKPGKPPPSVKNQIRSYERLLKKPDLDPKMRARNEAKLEELRKAQEDHQRQDRERKFAVRYHKVRFFERVKLERRLKKVQAQLAAASSGGEAAADAQAVATLQAQADAVQEDLEYVLHFPKGEKYVAVLRDAEDPAAQAQVAAERARLRALVKRQLAEAALLGEADEGAGRAAAGARGALAGAAAAADGEGGAAEEGHEADDFFLGSDDEEGGAEAAVAPAAAPATRPAVAAKAAGGKAAGCKRSAQQAAMEQRDGGSEEGDGSSSEEEAEAGGGSSGGEGAGEEAEQRRPAQQQGVGAPQRQQQHQRQGGGKPWQQQRQGGGKPWQQQDKVQQRDGGGGKPWSGGGKPQRPGGKPWQQQQSAGGGGKPWQPKEAGGGKPWQPKEAGGGKPWQGKSPQQHGKPGGKPWQPKQGSGGGKQQQAGGLPHQAGGKPQQPGAPLRSRAEGGRKRRKK
ncbi:rRNA-processing EFG1 [Micractinium conductrix]|uniref:rRNA-processing EFG1 n=1 Tax=Micractinium conductrix TaxID=554055 RepID=A0A2P6VAJ2_9CHLO|nr:rRNA-processing EFG1 [Micractinium conductrix]|eukprot:PSC71107.1 rRNA-processing EFG1 [Micractinium conductrix]